jgi:glutaminyl-peptide cyclotransferase
LDMVGGKNAKFVWEAYSAEYANFVLNHTWGIANELGYADIFQYKSIGPIIDDHKYVYDGTKIPMIDIIQYDENNGFAPYWHTHDDNLESIDKSTLKAVGNTVHHVVFNQP